MTVEAEDLRYGLNESDVVATDRVVTGIGSGYAIRVDNEGNLARVGLNSEFKAASKEGQGRR